MTRGTGLKRRSLFAEEEEESLRQQRRKFVACVDTSNRFRHLDETTLTNTKLQMPAMPRSQNQMFWRSTL